jgi:predicted transcriptional regulator
LLIDIDGLVKHGHFDPGSKGSGPSCAISATAKLVSIYASHNALASDELIALIADVHSAMLKLGRPVEEEAPKPVPAVSIKKSITPDYVICLDDGKKFKSLKRHLRTAYGMTPDDYRAKWKLPVSYPMVAPNYAAQRSELARSGGLGRNRAKAQAAQKAEPTATGKSSGTKTRRAKAS